jgi:DNA-binding PadR family transcriptional regulator
MNVRLVVLGLLSEAPRHGYEIRRWLELSRAELWTSVLPGSIYHALRQLEKEGLVAAPSIEPTGNRARAVYRITEAGRAELRALLLDRLQRPPRSFSPDLYAALTFADRLTPAELRAALQHLLQVLDAERAQWTEGAEQKMRYGAMTPLIAALFENGQEHIATDVRLVRRLLDALPADAEPG